MNFNSKKKKYKSEYYEDDNVYFNIEIRNDTNKFGVPARYSAQRTIPIIDDASKYYCSIVRFNIPNHFVPLLIPSIQLNQANVNLTQYSVTLEYNGDIQQSYLIYTNQTGFSAPTGPIGDVQPVTLYYFIFDYQHFVDMINTALSNSFSSLSTTPMGSSTPFLTFNSVTNLFTIYAQSDYYNINLATPIKIYLNGKLSNLINGFPSTNTASSETFTNDGRDIQLLVQNYFNNYIDSAGNNFPTPAGAYYFLQQEFSTIFNWNPFKRVVIVSNTLPINSEYVKGSGSAQLKIITDFLPYVTHEVRTIWQFVPEGQYRLCDMVTNQEITQIDLQIYWIDQYDNFYPLYIPWNQEATIKLGFFNKKLYKNFY